MNMRPMFRPEVPLSLTLEKNCRVLGSSHTILLSCSWCCFMASKEMPCSASLKPTISAMSSSGRKPLGITQNCHAVAHGPLQGHVIPAQAAVEHSFQRVVGAPVPFPQMWPQETAAQHGRQTQRHHAR